jgi:hypothetical protein
VRDVIGADDKDDKGEDLFEPGIEEYVFSFVTIERPSVHDQLSERLWGNNLLDTYSNSDVNDEEVFEPMSAAARRAAEAKMRQRDRMACVLLPGAICPPFLIAMTWALRMMTNLDCLERVRVRVGSMISRGILTIWKVLEMYVFPCAL